QDLVARSTPEAHFERTKLSDIDHLMAFNWVRNPPLQARRKRLGVLAKACHDGDLPFLHNHEAAKAPDDDTYEEQNAQQLGRTGRHRRHAAAPTTSRPPRPPGAAFVAKQRPQAIVEILPDLVEIRGTIIL